MKKALREKSREKRKAISANLRAEKSKKIRELLESTKEFKDAKKILLYISTEEEVHTHELTKDSINSDKKVYVPKVTGSQLAVCPILAWDELKPGTHGVLEPCSVLDPANPEEIDLIIVPGIAFDQYGHRIGYGKGFYDSLLSLTKGVKIGLAFKEQITEKIPFEDHDIPVDFIITDEKIIKPSKNINN